MTIDAHIHSRDFNESYKETVKHSLGVAFDSGLSAIFAMPNTNPPIIDQKTVEGYLNLAEQSNSKVFFGIYVGLTADIEQIKRAVDLYRIFFPKIVGMKLYAGHSTNNLGVIKAEEQQAVYETLSKEGFTGVLGIHAEKESELHPKIWNPQTPISHCFARPEKAEYESVKDQIELAKSTNFRGKLHILHTSGYSTVELVKKAKREGLDITCSTCPHYLIFDWTAMETHGTLLKMNPPLRQTGTPKLLLKCLKEGSISWIETDHAPHSLKEKTEYPFLSGIPGLPWWPLYIELLRRNDFTERQIKDITHNNIINRFDIDIKNQKRRIINRSSDYPYNPYKKLQEKLLGK